MNKEIDELPDCVVDFLMWHHFGIVSLEFFSPSFPSYSLSYAKFILFYFNIHIIKCTYIIIIHKKKFLPS